MIQQAIGVPTRRVLFHLFVLASSVAAPSAVGGTSQWIAPDAYWDDPAAWSPAPPTLADDARLDVSGATVRLDSGLSAQGRQIIVGRNATDVRVVANGGQITANTELLVGQYTGSRGRLEMDGGVLNTVSNFSVGGTGFGQLWMRDTALAVGGVFHVNRYTGATAAGKATISGGSVSANTLYIGSAGKLLLDDTVMTLNGDKRNLVNGYLASGAIDTLWGDFATIGVTYDGVQTHVSASNGRAGGIAAFGPETLGERAITFDYTGVRRVDPAPAASVHPRVYFNADELPAIRDRLKQTAVGQEAAKMVRYYTRLLREGRGYFDALPAAEKIMPDDTARIGNLSLYGDRSILYNQLIADAQSGNYTQSTALLAAQSSSTICTLGGLMALEAFECLIDEGQPGVATRSANLAAALDSWARWSLTQTDIPTGAVWKFAEHQTALAYDLAFNSMNSTQQATVRKALARVATYYMNRFGGVYYGATWTPESVTSNWIALDSYEVLHACAIEGETTLAADGLAAAAVTTWIDGAMKAFHKFHTYGWWATGAPYEGQGKNYLFAAHQIAFARRGYDNFGHPRVRAYGNSWLPAVTQPYGYAFTAYDVLGGTGSDPVRGGLLLQANDFIGLKWMFPQDPGVDFAWRNYVRTEKSNNAGVTVNFLDLRDSKFTPRDARYNNLLAVAIFPSDVASTDSWENQNAAVLGGENGDLDYLDNEGGTLVARSGYDANAAALHVHVRQDFGGHTHADRGAFTFAALGRLFFDYNSARGQSGNMQAAEFNGTILVDGLASKVTNREGNKMRIPAKVAAWNVNSGPASFITGDSTYSYSNEWEWFAYPAGGTMPYRSGFSIPETACFNDFLRLGATPAEDNRIAESYGNTPFFAFPYWNGSNQLEGIQKRPYNPMNKVYRSAGLVRGVRPYAVIFDDIRKDDNAHTYKWIGPIADDLEIVTGSALPAGANPATDIVLQEPAATGDRRVLVRILRADGTPVQAAGSTGSALAYRDTCSDSYNDSHARLVIERAAVVEPVFRILILPFRAGESLPITYMNTSPTNDYFVVNWATQNDLFSMQKRTPTIGGQGVTVREFIFKRGGVQQLDYRNKIEPISIR